MPPSHQHYSDWSPERFTRWAKKIGPDTERLIQVVLGSREHPEQAYRSCLGILGFANKHGQERLETTSGYALAHDVFSYRGIKNILKNKLDQLGPDEGAPQLSLLPPHTNIRGQDYYN